MRKIILILSFVFLAITYIFPCFILPIGTYKGTIKDNETKIELSLKFKFTGKVETKSGKNDSISYYYKIKGDEIIISDDKTFNNEDIKVSIDSFNKINAVSLTNDMSFGIAEYENKIASFITYGVLVLDAVLIITIPKKKKKRF